MSLQVIAAEGEVEEMEGLVSLALERGLVQGSGLVAACEGGVVRALLASEIGSALFPEVLGLALPSSTSSKKQTKTNVVPVFLHNHRIFTCDQKVSGKNLKVVHSLQQSWRTLRLFFFKFNFRH